MTTLIAPLLLMSTELINDFIAFIIIYYLPVGAKIVTPTVSTCWSACANACRSQ